MARLSDDDNDKVLWLTLAQSWVRLAEHVAQAHLSPALAQDGEEIPETQFSGEEFSDEG